MAKVLGVGGVFFKAERSEPYGVVAWTMDPAGPKLELWQAAPQEGDPA